MQDVAGDRLCKRQGVGRKLEARGGNTDARFPWLHFPKKSALQPAALVGISWRGTVSGLGVRR
jgi:hypothetical protein